MKKEFSIRTFCTEEDFDLAAAQYIVCRMKANAHSVIGLSTGRTTYNIHRQIVRLYKEAPFYIGGITFFGVDEVVGVDKTYSGSCYTMLRHELLDDLGVLPEQFLILPTHSTDYSTECRSFVQEIERRGGVDLLMLGLGENGHLGFNQPGTEFAQGAWVANMDSALEQRIRRETSSPDEVWLGGATLGLKDIMQARKVVLVAKGRHKADAVRRMLQGPVTTDCPASILQSHPCCEFLFYDCL